MSSIGKAVLDLYNNVTDTRKVPGMWVASITALETLQSTGILGFSFTNMWKTLFSNVGTPCVALGIYLQHPRCLLFFCSSVGRERPLQRLVQIHYLTWSWGKNSWSHGFCVQTLITDWNLISIFILKFIVKCQLKEWIPVGEKIRAAVVWFL